MLVTGNLLLSGCVGLGVSVEGNQEMTLSNPRINVQKNGLDPEENPAPWIKSEDLLYYWGEPDKKKQMEDGSVLWKYKFGLRWNGIGTLLGVIPLPLMLPVGKDYIEFKIENDWIVSATTKQNAQTAVYGCVFILLVPHGSPGADCEFGAVTQDKWKNSFLNRPHTVYRIKVANQRNDSLTLVFRARNVEEERLEEHSFVLKPKETRHILADGHGEELAVTSPLGKKIARQLRPDALNPKTHFNTSLFYLITDTQIVPVPVKYWDNWRSQIKNIIGSP